MKNKRAKRLVIYLFLICALVSSGFYFYKKINHQKPIAAKLVLKILNDEDRY